MTTSEWENEKKTNPNEYSHEPEVQMTDNIRLHCYFANLMLLIDFFSSTAVSLFFFHSFSKIDRRMNDLRITVAFLIE